jgi:2-C-methyl-D-erythritol 2,4-cyclodiphosphate synthase
VDGGPLRIGGCDVPFDRHLAGHSDADVLLHAITDALLGAAALGDIGEMFPNTDPANRGKDSGVMLRAAYEKVRDRGCRIVNLDCVIHAELPKISPHKNQIRHAIAGLLELSLDQVALKGKTGEGVGAVGKGEIVEAQCVVLLETDSGREAGSQTVVR